MRSRRFVVVLVAVAYVAAAAVSVSCAEQKASVTAKTRSIAAFKNGLGFFVKDGEAVLSDGWAVYDGIPPAALGTFWVGSNKPGVGIERLVAAEEEVIKTVPAISIAEMLSANIGAEVALAVGDRVIRGKLVAAPEDRKPAGEQPAVRGYRYDPQPQLQSSMILVEGSADGTTAVNKNEVKWVSFFPKAASSDFSTKEKVKRLRFKVSGASDRAPVTIAYLQKGIAWSPAYLVELIDDKKARITMQGLLVNDVEDVDNVDVSFVVGFPNFILSDVISPLALTQSLTDFVERLRSGQTSIGAGHASNMMSQSVSFYGGDERSRVSGDQFGYSAGADTPGAPEEDLFLYQMKNVSLKKGERAYYTIFSAEAPYEHTYEWAAPDTSSIQPSGYVDESRRNEQVPMAEQIWHKLKLTNTSKYPFTTAPAMAMSGGQPLSQDTIDYTPKGANTDLRITVATDLKGSKSEVEKSRTSATIAGRNYIDATVDGKLTVKSFKTRPVTLTIKKTIIGEALTIGQNGKVTKSMEGLRSVNPKSIITWEVPLQPGEEKTVSYTYHTYFQ